jgi:hypothetical protein
MTMNTSYFDSAHQNAYIQSTGRRHVDHSMDAACEFQLYPKEFSNELVSRHANAWVSSFALLDRRVSKVDLWRSTKIKARFTIVSREMAAN